MKMKLYYLLKFPYYEIQLVLTSFSKSETNTIWDPFLAIIYFSMHSIHRCELFLNLSTLSIGMLPKLRPSEVGLVRSSLEYRPTKRSLITDLDSSGSSIVHLSL